MAQNYLVQQSFFALAKEVTWGTPVTPPTIFIPMLQPKWTPKLKWLPDISMVGSPSETRDYVPGKRNDEVSFKHNMYLDSYGAVMLGLLGGPDTVTGTGPYTHTIKLLNNVSVASQPPSYTMYYFDSSQARQIPGSKLGSLDISWNADGAVECTSNWIGGFEADVSTPTNTPSTANFVPGWDVAMSVGGSPFLIFVSGSINITRGTQAIFTSDGTQAPHYVFTGAIEVKGKAKLLVEASGFNPFSGSNSALQRNQLLATIVFTDPVSSNTLTLTMTKTQFTNPVIDAGSKYLLADCEFEAIANTTDAASGISPISAVLVNSQAAAY